jgi:hypothetical protein
MKHSLLSSWTRTSLHEGRMDPVDTLVVKVRGPIGQ